MKRYGVVDFGSNTIRLCIYQIDDARTKKFSANDISILLNYKEMAGIASYVEKDELNIKGIRKATRIIRKHLERASYFGCDEIKVFATAVLRNCSNSKVAKKQIEDLSGASIDLLSNEEEADLGLLGASLDCDLCDATLVDLGGGSTELNSLSGGNKHDRTSIPQGSLSSFSLFEKGILPSKSEMKKIAKQFNKHLDSLDLAHYEHEHLVGIGGAIRAAAKVYGDLFNDGERSNVLLPEHLRSILEEYSDDPQIFAHRAIRSIPDRIHTFIPGCIIISEVFSRLGATDLSIAKYGVREGYLISRILKR